ncbi:hypothetical protein [Mucilaginibacter ginsenosidivorax]|uniref:Uncharacterized protein n=1 Tax=Mucilaginibacter ginsenosidivorax TaxID=862126 RepID=A0A5B8W406_9SPHI|nr:hypothetical protein [Mucilaginibacter ginsenosidivorax]QEC77705.1 hypothetical protein FSB76_17805 [Mucilaginibacter ginsenosidivorax]
MRYIYSIIKADYLQRTRSYAFLITLAITFYAAYSFVPPPTASYTTLNVVGFKGVYNSAWVGYVSGMMTAIMLSLYGFFLVNGGIKKDIDTEVGLIIATTPITNFEYLLSKMLSNLLVLLTIAGCTFVVSIIMFFVRTSGSSFIISNFIIPYLLFVVPAMVFISSLAVVAEVFLGRKSILQYIAFFFFFGALMANVNGQKNETLAVIIDPYGVRTMTTSIKNQVNTQYHQHIEGVNLGFTFNSKRGFRIFEWNAITITGLFLASRLLWLMLSMGLVYLSSFFFHRFDFKRALKKKAAVADPQLTTPAFAATGINRTLMPPLVTDYGIFPFIKTELLLLVRKGSKWLWLIIAGVSISMLFAPIGISHLYILPVLWFLQVTRLSELATKEETYRLHYFTYASYKPLQRMLPAQILAGAILGIVLAFPLILRYVIAGNGYAIFNIISGAVCIVLLAVCIGIISKGKKLFEIIFFLLTYALTQAIPIADYLGAIPHNNHIIYIAVILGLNVFLAIVSFVVRGYQSRHL